MSITSQANPVANPVANLPANFPKEHILSIQRRAIAKALLECAEIMENKKLPYYVARFKLEHNNTYWLNHCPNFYMFRYAGEQTMPYATIQHQIDMVLLTREHILQIGLLNSFGKDLVE